MNEHDERTKQLSSWESLTYSRWTYNEIPIFQISKGNKNWFRKSGSLEIGGKITVFGWGEGNALWFKLSVDSNKLSVQRIGISIFRGESQSGKI